MAAGRIPTTANSPLTAKGDLFTYSTAPARLAVGNNGETVVADSSTSTGLRYQAHTEAGKNFIINGGMDIWQRGTSVASSGNTYTADRFQTWSQGGAATTTSRQATSDTTNLPSIQYCARVQRNSGQTITSAIVLQNSLESVNSIPMAGKTVVLSFYARAGANFSASGNTLNAAIYYGTGTDQGLASYTGATVVASSAPTLTTTWQRFQITGTVATTATEVAFQSYYVPTGTAGVNDYFEITGIQLELGSTASTFSRTGGSIQGELAACQRYYYRVTAVASGRRWANGFNSSTGGSVFLLNYPVTMRTQPTALEQSGTAGDYTIAYESSVATATSVPAFSSATEYAAIFTISATGLTSGQAVMIRTANASAYLGWSAEL